jgi:hypothetical protein
VTKLLLVVILLLIWLFARGLLRHKRADHRASPLHRDSSRNLEELVRRLMNSTSDNAFLIVGMENSEDFLQMTGGPTGVQLDFPMITDRQKSLESRIRESAARQGLSVQENRGSGDLFLDIDIKGEPGHIAAVCRRFIAEVFGAAHGTFRYEYDGLD